MILTAQRLSAIAFAPFGRVLDGADVPPSSVNQGRGRRRTLVHLSGSGGRAVQARYDLQETPFPVAIEVMERHPHSDQSFFALGGASALVVVAPTGDDGAPAMARAKAFIAGPETPFLYRAGIWHAPLFALGGAGRFLMAMEEIGPAAGANTEVVRLASPLQVTPGSPDHRITAEQDQGSSRP
ncbi:MAG: ureidoglycolate lyase [Enterovirga sp.]|nr:ureidoglycolate lyase [Enterovirga sp.]